MSISKKILEIDSARVKIKSSISNKGVEMEDTTPLNEYSAHIDSIEAAKEEEEFTTDITQNGQFVITPDDGKVLSKVTINANIPNGVDITKPYVNLRDYQGDGSVPKEITGWNKLVDGTNKCNGARLATFNIDMPALENGTNMFYNNVGLFTFESKMPKLTNSDSMFTGCSSLASFDSDLSKLTRSNSMFYGCRKLTSFDVELPELDYGYNMFYECNGLTSFNVTELPKLTNGNRMFRGCSKLISFNSDTPKLTNGEQMFYQCSAFTNFQGDLSSLTNSSSMFGYCRALTNVTLIATLNCAIDWSYCPLTVDSMLSIMNAMVDLSGQSSKTMTFGSDNLAKLNDEQKSIATAKNWALA